MSVYKDFSQVVAFERECVGRHQPGAAHTGHVGQCQERGRVVRRDPPGGAELHVEKGPGPGLEHGQAACLHRRKKLQLVVAVFLRLHDFTARGDARQQRQAFIRDQLASLQATIQQTQSEITATQVELENAFSALEISERLGLPAAVLSRARELLGWGVEAFCTDRIDLISPDFS